MAEETPRAFPPNVPAPPLPRKGQKANVPRGRYKARGIVLHAMKYGDRKLIVRIFTAAYGRRSYVAKLSAQNGTRGFFQPLFILDFDAWAGRSEMHNIEQPQLGVALSQMPFDIVKSSIALFLSELLYRLIQDDEPDPGLYRFVEEAITELDDMEEGVANFHLWFLVRLTEYMGYAPRDTYVPGYSLDYRNGLYTADPPAHTLVMPPTEAALFHTLNACRPEELGAVGLAREQRVALLERLIDLYGYHTDAIYNVNSLRILSEIF